MRNKNKKILIIVIMFMFVILTACGDLNESTIEGPSNSGGDATDSEVTLNLGHVFAEDDLIHESTVKLAELANEYSDGEIKIDIFSNSQLGGERELVEGVQMGTVDIALAANAPLTSFIPSLVYWDLPYLIDSLEHMDRIQESDIKDALNAEFENNQLTNLGVQYGGFRQITNSVRPIESIEDFEGINIRLLESKVMLDTFESLPGIRTSNMAFAELYSGLQQGVVNAQENPINLIYSMRFQEVQDYLSLTNHFFTTRYYLMNSDSFNQLSTKQQEALTRATEEAMDHHKEVLFAYEEETLEILKEEGMEVNEVSDEFVNEFRGIMEEEVYGDYYSQAGNGDEAEGEAIIQQIIDLQ